MRTYSIMGFYSSRQDMDRTKIMYPNINFRYTVAPSESLTISPVPLDFSRAHLDWCIKIGEKDGKAAVEAGEGVYFKAILEHFYQAERGISADFTSILETISTKQVAQ